MLLKYATELYCYECATPPVLVVPSWRESQLEACVERCIDYLYFDTLRWASFWGGGGGLLRYLSLGDLKKMEKIISYVVTARIYR